MTVRQPPLVGVEGSVIVGAVSPLVYLCQRISTLPEIVPWSMEAAVPDTAVHPDGHVNAEMVPACDMMTKHTTMSSVAVFVGQLVSADESEPEVATELTKEIATRHPPPIYQPSCISTVMLLTMGLCLVTRVARM